MFSLDASHRYWFYNRPVNMRLGFNGLSGIVTNRMGMNLREGDVFVFVNAARNRMKILHREEGGLVLYSLRIEMGRMRMPFTGDTDEISGIRFPYLDSEVGYGKSICQEDETAFTGTLKSEIRDRKNQHSTCVKC